MDSQNKRDELIKYNEAIFDFEENYLKKIYKNIDNKEKDGYLIKSEDLDELKENISYSKYKINRNGNKDYFNKNYDLNKLNDIKKIKQIEFKTSQYLVNMILNDNKYIIINEKLWKILCDKKYENDTSIKYNIDKENLTLSFDKEKKLYFSNKENNIIDKFSYLKQKSDLHLNFKEITDIHDVIKTYNEFENEFIKKLIGKKAFSLDHYSNTGYLISKSWLDKWKKYYNYENIKNKYLIDKNKDNYKQIINEIIYHQEKNKLNNERLEPIEILNINTAEGINPFLAKDSLVIIDNNIKLLFKSFNQNYSIKYCGKGNKIYILNDENLSFNAYNNIIFSKENYNLSHLNIMLKIHFFQSEMNQLINSSYKNENNNTTNKIYLINKNILEVYKEILEYDILIKDLKKK